MDLPQIEDEAIVKDQTFELIYTQSGYLYIVLPHVPWPTSSTSRDTSHATNALIGAMHQQSAPFSQVQPYGFPPQHVHTSTYQPPPYLLMSNSF